MKGRRPPKNKSTSIPNIVTEGENLTNTNITSINEDPVPLAQLKQNNAVLLGDDGQKRLRQVMSQEQLLAGHLHSLGRL